MENKNYGHFKNNIITFCKRKVLNIIKHAQKSYTICNLTLISLKMSSVI